MREFGRRSDKRLDPISVNEVLVKTSEIFSQQLKARGIDMVWDLADSLPRVRADANRLEQVFINLLINARDAIEEKVQAHPHQKGEKRIYLASRRRDGFVEVEVRDSGKGIPRKLIAKIFEPFFTTKEVGKGTGLGLSISYQIVQDFGGTIRAHSREGEGAAFMIRFPAAER
jgi:histidine kinase